MCVWGGMHYTRWGECDPSPCCLRLVQVLSRLSKMMQECWYIEPNARPTAANLKKRMARLLQASVVVAPASTNTGWRGRETEMTLLFILLLSSISHSVKIKMSSYFSTSYFRSMYVIHRSSAVMTARLTAPPVLHFSCDLYNTLYSLCVGVCMYVHVDGDQSCVCW